MGGCTFVCEGLASFFFPCTDTFPAAAVATEAGFNDFAGSTLGASAFTVAAVVLYDTSGVNPLQAEPTRKHPEAKSRKKPRESDEMEQKEKEVADSVTTVSAVVAQSKTGILSPSLLCCLIRNRLS